MCGVAGFLDYSTVQNADELRATAHAMADTIKHRGPDDAGVWLDERVGIALSHRRLSILDLSVAGHQPMASSSGRYVIVFNGEIYNHHSLRKELIDVVWRGHSDTETLLACFEAWGIESTIKKTIGMFAIALWDQRDQILTLVRDRLGEKPLYYGWMGRAFVFSSELKALRVHPEWLNNIDRNALALYMRHNYIPSPYSIYKNIYKLKQGAYIQISCHGHIGDLPEPKYYWDASKVTVNAIRNPLDLSENEVVDSLDSLLKDTIADKMISDVPLGAFLSGGYDSTIIVSAMQAISSKPIKTFSIGFLEEGYNEAVYAKAVAEYLGTEHKEFYLTSEQAIEVIPKLGSLYDEPFSDSSQIPMYLVSQMAKNHVTVALSGDGGDELFGGYGRYFFADSMWKNIKNIPYPIRRLIASGIKIIPLSLLNASPRIFTKLQKGFGRQGMMGDKLYKSTSLLTSKNFLDLYSSLTSHWKDPSDIVQGAEDPLISMDDILRRTHDLDKFQQMQFIDMVTYLPDDILVKLDRASMGVSLETRVPFLDHRIVEFAWRIPQAMKTRNGQGKRILKEVLNRYVPRELMDRPKIGFGVPIDTWLRGPLKDWVESHLNEHRLITQGYLNPKPIRQKLHEHLSGKRNWSYYLWDVLMFQSWLDHQME